MNKKKEVKEKLYRCPWCGYSHKHLVNVQKHEKSCVQRPKSDSNEADTE